MSMKRNPDIKYVNPEIAEFDLPPLQGTRYTDTVPDTLDLAERARAALHGMTEMTDPAANYELYWAAIFGAHRPFMFHDLNDWIEYKFYGPTALLRTVCGSSQNEHVDRHRMATLCQMRGPDGLLYEPVAGRPWCKNWGFGGRQYEQDQGEHYAGIGMAGTQMEAALVFWKVTGDDSWRQLAEGILHGAESRLIDKGRYGYYLGAGVFTPAASADDGPEPRYTVNHMGAWTAHGAVSLCRMTGSERAARLAHKLARFLVERSGIVKPDGDFGWTHGSDEGDGEQWRATHFHANTKVRYTLLDTGLVTGDRELVDLAMAGYEFGKKHGDTLMGFFPEFLEDADGHPRTCEICEVADMLCLALRQSVLGLKDCWDDVDRWVRNMFTEGQILDAGWAEEYAAHLESKETHPYACYDNVADRVRGVWCGWIAPNQLQGLSNNTIMNCCTGNAAMQLFRVWREMARFNDDTLWIHLLLNKAMPEADVYSCVPNRGRVEVRLKTDCRVSIRVPEWSTAQECSFHVDSETVQPAWEGRYGTVAAAEGQTVSMECPIAERTEHRVIQCRDWALTVRGNTIVDINPPGTWGPIHSRPEYRTTEPKTVRRERYLHPCVVEI